MPLPSKLDYIIEDISRGNLSLESIEKTKELLEFLSDKIRQEYDIAKRLLLSDDFTLVYDHLKSERPELTKEQALRLLTDGKMTLMRGQLQERFISCLDVQG